MNNWIPLIVALIAATAALIGYVVNSGISRRTEKVRYYADALTAMEKYRQLPSTFKRRHDSNPETRAELAKMIGDIEIELAFFRRWLDLDSPPLGRAYARLVEKIRKTNATFRREALSSPIARNDSDIEIGLPYHFEVQTELEECVTLMRHELKLLKRPSK